MAPSPSPAPPPRPPRRFRTRSHPAPVNFFPQQGSPNADGIPTLGYVSVTGMNPSGYNGTFKVTSSNSTSITYQVTLKVGFLLVEE